MHTMRYINPQHRGHRLQRGRGLASFAGSIYKVLKPLFKSGINFGKTALKNPDIQAGLKDVQSSAIKAGVRKIDQVLNPKPVKQGVVKKRKTVTKSNVVPKKKKVNKKGLGFKTKRGIFDQ